MKLLLKLTLCIAVSVSFIACNNSSKQTTNDANKTDSTTVSSQNDSVSTNLPTIIDFNATWCGPCRQMAPIIEEMAAKYKGKVEIKKVDIDANPDLATQYDISSIPTLVYLDAQGNEKNRTVGYLDAKELDSQISSLLK